jgi:hypothetical protein
MLALGPVALEIEEPDFFGIGLVLAIVGSFLLANSILFRHPRTLVADHFGRGARRLTSIREYIFHRVQVHLGFLFLLVGFGLQLYGHYRPPAAESGPPGLSILWIGAILLTVVVLELVGWWLSHWLFRRYVREYFLEHPPELETDMRLARELGDLFNIASSGDDTVPSYLAQIRRRIGLPTTRREVQRQRQMHARDEHLMESGEVEREGERA